MVSTQSTVWSRVTGSYCPMSMLLELICVSIVFVVDEVCNSTSATDGPISVAELISANAEAKFMMVRQYMVGLGDNVWAKAMLDEFRSQLVEGIRLSDGQTYL